MLDLTMCIITVGTKLEIGGAEISVNDWKTGTIIIIPSLYDM